MSVICLSAAHIIENRTAELHQIFVHKLPMAWRGFALAALRYVMYT